MHGRHHRPLLQPLDADVPIPHRPGMVLKADVSLPGEVFQGLAELVGRAVGVLTGFGPAVQVHLEDLLAVDVNRDQVVFAGDAIPVPLTRRFGHVLGRSGTVVDCPGRSLAVRFLAVAVAHLDLDARVDGIAEIREQTLQAKEVLERLAERIGEIGEIVDVIGGINDEANLLSLNAAIIAAQAGEQGKAFAVVANHVKTLAQRTTSSTREIEGLIRAVQQESSNAVTAMARGIEAVEKGVDRSRNAGEELDKIRTSSEEASSRVAEIARATGEQTRNSKHVAEAAQRTSSMVQQISGAMSEQSKAGEAMLKNAESALEMCRQVHRSTEEQKESGRFITASISSVTEMIRSIQQNTESHGAASEAVADAVTRILEIARKSGQRIPEVVSALESLRAEAQTLAGATASVDETAAPSDGGA